MTESATVDKQNLNLIVIRELNFILLALWLPTVNLNIGVLPKMGVHDKAKNGTWKLVKLEGFQIWVIYFVPGQAHGRGERKQSVRTIL